MKAVSRTAMPEYLAIRPTRSTRLLSPSRVTARAYVSEVSSCLTKELTTELDDDRFLLAESGERPPVSNDVNYRRIQTDGDRL